MTAKSKQQRVGVEINDDAVLWKLARAVAAQPDASMTGLLRELGETDSATVRRVRRKFRQRGPELLKSLDQQPRNTADRVKTKAVAPPCSHRDPASQRSPEPEKADSEADGYQDTKPKPAPSQASRASKRPDPAPNPWLDATTRWTSTLLQSQLDLAKTVYRQPPMRFVLEQQAIAFNMMLSLWFSPTIPKGKRRDDADT